MIFVGVKYIQSNMRRSIGFQIIRIVCAIILFITSLSTGGRGGFILIVADILFWFVLYMVRRKRYKQLVVSVAFLIIGYFVVNNIIGKSVSLQLGFARVFEFIGPEGFNWAGTSGRDVIYQKAINIIKQSPIVGYGITGGNYHGVKSCHNWFLEMMVEGGILYLGFWVFLLLTFTKKIIKAVRHDECYLLIWTIFTTDFIGLMFSFISWRCTAIWFAIFYVLNVTLEKPEASK
jgi:O-antigen ligase